VGTLGIQITDKYHRDTLSPIREKADRIVNYTVEYGRLALRTALELNGGGIIALPSLVRCLDQFGTMDTLCRLALSLRLGI
jgi:hypothetical protein